AEVPTRQVTALPLCPCICLDLSVPLAPFSCICHLSLPLFALAPSHCSLHLSSCLHLQMTAMRDSCRDQHTLCNSHTWAQLSSAAANITLKDNFTYSITNAE
uniref:Uncharacterized protein n=1 Tax=Amphiprion ocellaris TaxID=80972 RepID=A0A3Q1AW86_AMPOC